MESKPLQGHCLCGADTITVSGSHDPRPGICHCRMCQRWSGGVFMCFEVQPEAVTVTGEVACFASSRFAERAFCPKCGSHLWMRNTQSDEDVYELMPGLFDEAKDWPIRSEIYTDAALTSAVFAGDHPKATRAHYEAKNLYVE